MELRNEDGDGADYWLGVRTGMRHGGWGSKLEWKIAFKKKCLNMGHGDGNVNGAGLMLLKVISIAQGLGIVLALGKALRLGMDLWLGIALALGMILVLGRAPRLGITMRLGMAMGLGKALGLSMALELGMALGLNMLWGVTETMLQKSQRNRPITPKHIGQQKKNCNGKIRPEKTCLFHK